ncbi:MAG: hypothetical protein FWD69_03715 [Polyangiaceae bacterium]|nr:hypothetical protein [Polyangiaceae bacterium]
MHSLNVIALALLVTLPATVSCGGSPLARPPRVQVKSEDYVAVPFPPRPPLVEVVPPRPRNDAVWVDGGWDWDGDRYRWTAGSWVIAPEGARFARWVIVRRNTDGQLFFAPSGWRDTNSHPIPAPQPLVSAKTTSGGAAGAIDQ